MSNEIFELLRADNTIYANRTLAAAIGLNEAVIYSALLGKEHYYRSNNQLDDAGMFYATAVDLEEKTTLTQRQQDRAINHLEEYGLIQTQLKGLPARKYFKINPDSEVVLKLMREKPKSKPDKDSNSNSGNEKEPNATECEGETSFDKMLKLDSAEQQNKFQQNVETGIDKTSKQVSTESKNKNQQNSEAINISNNKNIYNKNNNSAYTCDETDNKKEQTDNNYSEIINRFTQNEQVRTALWEYVKMRQRRSKTVTTDYVIELALKRLGELSDNSETQIKILNQSILNSYPDLYELKEKDLKKRSENNDYRGNNGNNGYNHREDRVYNTGLAGNKTDAGKYNSLPGVVKLG